MLIVTRKRDNSSSRNPPPILLFLVPIYTCQSSWLKVLKITKIQWSNTRQIYVKCQRGSSSAACIIWDGNPSVLFPEISEISRVAIPEVHLGLPQTFKMERFATIVNSQKTVTNAFKAPTYKHSTCIPRWNDVETVVSTSFQRGIHVKCLWGLS